MVIVYSEVPTTCNATVWKNAICCVCWVFFSEFKIRKEHDLNV